MKYVLDGGSIIHRIKWDNIMTYDEMVQRSGDFVLKTMLPLEFDEKRIITDSEELALSNKESKTKMIN